MIPDRYPAPSAAAIFNDRHKFELWKELTDAYAMQFAREGDTYSGEDLDQISATFSTTNPPTPEMVAEFEDGHGHDVVAFLDAYCTKLIGMRHLVHDGLTSSDLVDYGLFRMVSDHASQLSVTAIYLCRAMSNEGWFEMIRPGRTHGQIADHTTWGYQVYVHYVTLAEIRAALEDCAEDISVVKFAGPTGWPGALPQVHARGRSVADRLGAQYTPATQIVHRDRLLGWACLYLRLACALENLAQLVRAGARAEVAEVAEGAERAGSSAMPHKRNPIDAEKVCGLARVARGHFSAIAETVATWDDRDISNSSVERIAVPGLAATVEHMVLVMTKVMENLMVDRQRMEGSATSPACYTNIYQVVTQRQLRIGPVEASNLVRKAIAGYQNYPGMWLTSVRDEIVERGFDGQAWVDGVAEILNARFQREENKV